MALVQLGKPRQRGRGSHGDRQLVDLRAGCGHLVRLTSLDARGGRLLQVCGRIVAPPAGTGGCGRWHEGVVSEIILCGSLASARHPCWRSPQRRRAPRRLSHARALLERIRQLQQRRLAPLGPEQLDADRHARGARPPSARRSRPGNVSAGKPVLFDSTPLRSACSSPMRHHQPPLVRVEDRIEPVRGDRGHHRLPQVGAPAELLLVLGPIGSVGHSMVAFQDAPERRVEFAARHELVECLHRRRRDQGWRDSG